MESNINLDNLTITDLTKLSTKRILEELKETKSELKNTYNGFEQKIYSHVESVEKKILKYDSLFHEIIDKLAENKFYSDKIEQLLSRFSSMESSNLNHYCSFNILQKDFIEAKNKLDKIYINNLYLPGQIGDCCRYKNLKEFLVYAIDKFNDFDINKEITKEKIKFCEEKINNLFTQFQKIDSTLKETVVNYTDIKEKTMQKKIDDFKIEIIGIINKTKLDNINNNLDIKNEIEYLTKAKNSYEEYKSTTQNSITDILWKIEKISKTLNKIKTNFKNYYSFKCKNKYKNNNFLTTNYLSDKFKSSLDNKKNFSFLTDNSLDKKFQKRDSCILTKSGRISFNPTDKKSSKNNNACITSSNLDILLYSNNSNYSNSHISYNLNNDYHVESNSPKSNRVESSKKKDELKNNKNPVISINNVPEDDKISNLYSNNNLINNNLIEYSNNSKVIKEFLNSNSYSSSNKEDSESLEQIINNNVTEENENTNKNNTQNDSNLHSFHITSQEKKNELNIENKYYNENLDKNTNPNILINPCNNNIVNILNQKINNDNKKENSDLVVKRSVSSKKNSNVSCRMKTKDFTVNATSNDEIHKRIKVCNRDLIDKNKQIKNNSNKKYKLSIKNKLFFTKTNSFSKNKFMLNNSSYVNIIQENSKKLKFKIKNLHLSKSFNNKENKINDLFHKTVYLSHKKHNKNCQNNLKGSENRNKRNKSNLNILAKPINFQKTKKLNI